MRLIILICILFLSSCANKKEDFFQCAKRAKVFSRENAIPIRFDTNKTFYDIKILSNEIRDTLQKFTPFGFIYNYADSNFIPNADPTYNLIIEQILIIPKNSSVNISYADLILFITHDSIEIFDEFKNTNLIFPKDDIRIRESINDYYHTAYCKNENIWKSKYTHVVIPDSLNFDEYLLPYIRMMMSSYKQSMENYAFMNNVNICDSMFLKGTFRTRGAIEFMVLVNDFDYEKKKKK
jgi:hypothetical protein